MAMTVPQKWDMLGIFNFLDSLVIIHKLNKPGGSYQRKPPNQFPPETPPGYRKLGKPNDCYFSTNLKILGYYFRQERLATRAHLKTRVICEQPLSRGALR